MVPGSITGNAHPGMTAALRIPLLDRREPTLVDQLLQLGEAQSAKLDRWEALGHATAIGLLRAVAQGRSRAK
jgi:hypothetical protein